MTDKAAYVRPKTPEPIKPIAERYAGENLPYRGIENHGVPIWDDSKPAPLDAPELDYAKEEPFDYPSAPAKPVAVEVINYKSIEANYFVLPVGTTPVRVLGKDRTRVRALIRCDDDIVYIGNNESVNTNTGAFISNVEAYTEIKATNELWAVCATGGTSSIYVVVECEVDLSTVE